MTELRIERRPVHRASGPEGRGRASEPGPSSVRRPGALERLGAVTVAAPTAATAAFARDRAARDPIAGWLQHHLRDLLAPWHLGGGRPHAPGSPRGPTMPEAPRGGPWPVEPPPGAEATLPATTAPEAPPQPALPAGREALDQYDVNNYQDPTNRAARDSTCGPTALQALSVAVGREISLDDAVNLARDNRLWDADSGMYGYGAFEKLAAAAGIDFHSVGADRDAAMSDEVKAQLAAHNPVVISTPRHYFVAQDYDPETGKYRVGNTGTLFRAGAEWMTVDEIMALGGGINGVGYAQG